MFPPLIVIFTLFPIFSVSQYVEQLEDCTTKLYSCGETIRWIGYPFWGQARPSYCGLPEFHLTCRDDNVTTVQISNTTFRVHRIDQNITNITLARDDLWEESDACLLRPQESINSTTFEQTVFSYIPDSFLFLGIYYSCSDRSIPIRNRLNCSRDEGERVSFIADRSISLGEEGCDREISVPVLRKAFDEFQRSDTMPLDAVLMQGFPVEYRVDGAGVCRRCESSGGTCWSGNSSSVPSCLCPGGISRLVCPGARITITLKLVIAFGSALLMIVLICIVKFSKSIYTTLFKHRTEDDRSVEAFIMQYGSLITKRYKYVDIKKMTNSFEVKLGQGGFGSVFKGKLSDGRPVAVKVLNSSKASGQEFINEVASIGMTSHVNIVALLGFCFEYSKRALIYEFMPNGSLEKFIDCDDPFKKSQHIEVNQLYEVALGIARGLDYLHRGCNTRILHLDIKPHNILLDEDYCPKIADFGLAKLYSRKESIVSMLEARGTVGYIAPEVFMRNFGGVSHKSDVYSYGMMILEIVGGRKNVDVGVCSERNSDIYFPNWIHNRLGKDNLLKGVTTEEENNYARKLTIVGLWCIQTNPTKRPSIKEVIEMLEGSMEALEVPPKPFFSPPRLPATTFDTLESDSGIIVTQQ